MSDGGTVAGLFDLMEETNAGVLKVVGRNEADEPYKAVIAIRGKEACKEILDAVEAIEAKWDAEAE